MSGNEERELEDLLKIKKRRLTTLRKQIAQYGYGARPELLTERDELEQEIGASSKVIEPIVKGELPDDIMAALRAYGVPASVNNALQLVEAALYELKKAFADHKQELHAVKDVVMPLRADVQALADRLAKSEAERVHGQRRNFRISIGNITLILFVLLIVIILFARAGLLW